MQTVALIWFSLCHLNFSGQMTTEIHNVLLTLKQAGQAGARTRKLLTLQKETVMLRFAVTIAPTLVLAFNISGVFAADIVETASNATTFKTFLAAIKSTDMNETLKSAGPFTVFAPSDAAFDKLPAGTVNALLKDKKKLSQLLAHHVIPGKVTVAEIKPGEVAALDGGALKLTSDNGKVTVDDANVTQSDIAADNGVIHEIDTVVMPK
jgi:hypothetical protein